MNIEEIKAMPDNSITDPETIRIIALTHDSSLFIKVKKGYEVYGLYPEIMKTMNIVPTRWE
jgi:hypothetical protein